MKIRKLAEGTINRIAAGEAVERPASAVEEAVGGMDEADLRLAVERHATSKLPQAGEADDLSRIATLGFRGEALPSIGAVARLLIQSRTAGGEAHQIQVDGGIVRGPAPCGFRAHGQSGTRVDVRDLFFATPARLKFLKSARSEELAVVDAVKRLAMARPDVGFSLTLDGRRALAFEREGDLFKGRLKRLAKIMGRDFEANAAPVGVEREGVRLSGFAGLPTYNRANTTMQFLFVNGRPVRDKLLIGVVRGAYADYLARDRHPALALFLDCDPAFVDVNVHPAKTEVRFRDSGLVRGLIVPSLKHALHEAGHRASTTVAGSALSAFRPHTAPFAHHAGAPANGLSEPGRDFHAPLFAPAPVSARVEDTPAAPAQQEVALGVARAQLHEPSLAPVRATGIVIVDQALMRGVLVDDD